MSVKQVIVMRTDLNMRKGKMCSQSAHASMKVILDTMQSDWFNFDGVITCKKTLYFNEKSFLDLWINGIFTKICVGVNSEKELMDLYNKSVEKGIICSIIEDCGLTEFKGIPTKTCCAIGPYLSEEIDEITGHLKLL